MYRDSDIVNIAREQNENAGEEDAFDRRRGGGGGSSGAHAEHKNAAPAAPPPSGEEQREAGENAEEKEAETAEMKRVRKWRKMLGVTISDWKSYVRVKPTVVQRRVRKGIPDSLRGYAWQVMSGGRELRIRNPGIYDQLVFFEHSAADHDIIKDICRTFPHHVFYSQRHGPGQRSLYNVLKAYSIYDRTVGYVQGMGFVAGTLLLFMSEEDAFWVLVALLKGAIHEPMDGLYGPGLPLVQRCLFQFEGLMADHLPRLSAHFARECIHPTMYASQWFITVFSYSLPFPVVLRIWDIFMLEGLKVVFQVGIALLQASEEDLLGLPFEVLAANLRHFPSKGTPTGAPGASPGAAAATAAATTLGAGGAAHGGIGGDGGKKKTSFGDRGRGGGGGGGGGGEGVAGGGGGGDVDGEEDGEGRGKEGSEIDPDELLERALSLRLSPRLEELRIEFEASQGGGGGGGTPGVHCEQAVGGGVGADGDGAV